MTMMEEEVSFPRGGGGRRRSEPTLVDQESDKKKNRKKRKSTEDDAPPATPQSIKADLLFGSKSKKSDSEKSSKKRKKSEVAVDTGKHSLLPLGGGGVVISTKKHKKDKSAGSTVVSTPIIEALNFSKLAKGTKLLACVREVQDTFAIVSLPNLLTAYMLPQPEYPLHRTLAVGQTLAVVVQKVVLETVAGGGGQTQRRIQVTAVPQAVNPRSLLMGDESSKNTQENTMASAANRLARASVPVRGQILSIEDHGCVVDLGFGARGFVRFEKIQDGENFVILEDDEDEAKEEGENIENEDDKAPPTVLQKGRLYDFLVLPVASKDLSATVFPLSLPPVSKLADKAVSELSMTLPSKENRQKTKEVGTPMTLASLTPGWLVQVKVEALATNGLCVSFLGNIFRGAMEMNHLGATLVPDSKNGAAASGPEGGWKHLASSLFHKHQHFCARILAVDVPTKLVRLSIAPQVLKMDRIADFTSALSGFPSEGTVVPDCTVVRLDPGIGALLALPTQYNYAGDVDELLPKSLTDSNEVFSNPSFQEACHVRKVYVHISKAMDETDEKSSSADGRFNKEFAPATKHSVRILNTTHWIEGIAAGGCAPSILEAKVLSHEDLVAGTVYKQVPVCAQMPGGSAMVQLGGTSQKRKGKKKISSNSITGILPPIQLFDTSSSGNSEYRQRIFQTKFAVDAKVDVRVLWVDPIRKRCLVTAKKTIVQAAPESIITSYAGLDVGQTAVGYISRIDDRGLYVTFCNKVYGRVTARSLATELGIENHRENYKVGDAVTCRVVKLQKTEKKRQRASVVDNDSEDENENENSSQSPSGQVFWDLTLSLRTRAVQGEETSDMVEDDIDICHPTPVALKVGVILPAKSMKIVDIVDGKLNKHGKFSHGYAVVSIKSKYLSDEESQETGKMTETLECKLPFDQLMDSFESSDIETVESMNCLARRSLVIGKKINQKGLVLLDPKKSNVDYATGVGKMPVVSIRREVIRVKEEQDKTSDSRNIPLLPSPVSDISVGSLLIGYVAETNPRFGGFIRFLDGMTGLITKKQKGHLLSLYSTVRVRVKAIDDTVEPKRILLSLDTEERPKHSITHDHAFEVGDKVEKAIVLDVNFYEISLEVPDLDLKETSIVVHCTTKDSNVLIPRHRKKPLKVSETLEITKSHPFYGIKIGQELTGFTVVSVHKRKQGIQVILTDRGECFETTASEELSSMIAKNLSDIHPGSKTRAVVVGYARGNKGLIVQVSPSVRGFIPGLELARDLDVLNGLQENIPRGAVLECVVLDEENFFKNRLRCPLPSFYKKKLQTGLKKEKTRRHSLMLSVLGRDSEPSPLGRPRKGELVIGMINSHIPQIHAPSLMLETRGGHVVRADITELEEPDEWRNMPLRSNTGNKAQNDKSTEDDDDSQADSEASKNNEDDLHESENAFQHGKYVECRVMKCDDQSNRVDVSLRASRIQGDLDEDPEPQVGDILQGFVITTNKNGCFVRLSNSVEGRSTLKEICDGFLPHPETTFPTGRLVVGKVKATRPIPKRGKGNHDSTTLQVDLDMRESTLMQDSENRVTFQDVQVGEKYKGFVQRVEAYGVFVQIENSDVSGLTHISECSEKFVKNLNTLFHPGDPVKVLVLKKDDEGQKIGFSMKASHFEDDEDSDASSIDSEMINVEDEDDKDAEMSDVREPQDDSDEESENDLDSDDENFASKLAAKMSQGKANRNDSSSSEEGSDSDDSEESGDEDGDDSSEDEEDRSNTLDTDVGFSWGASAFEKAKLKAVSQSQDSDSSDSSDSDSESEDDVRNESSKSHKSRKRQAERRREERETSRRELALADGTADENPETAGDFERLLAGDPNSSELWIRYMAFHLSLADIPSARRIADKAFERIDMRKEREKLNVWSALLKLEHKYGSEETFQAAIDRACQQNNSKQVYLRACEILENEVDESNHERNTVSRADQLFSTMCKKHKSKKKVWLAHMQYLLRQSRHQEAHALMKRAMLSLAPYKHAETMSKFAQMEFELGSSERGRTLFDGLLVKYPKRLDLFFVYLDKEVKYGKIEHARSMLEQKVQARKLSDKQMKSLFKKWYKMEEEHGTEETQEHVKESARNYVSSSASGN